MRAPVTKYNREESVAYMKKIAAGTARDRSLVLQYTVATLVSFGAVVAAVVLSMALLVVTIGAVQGAQYLCLKSKVCKA